VAQKFSSRTNWDLTESTFAAAIRERREAGGELLDLAVSNPTKCGFRYDEALLAPLASPAVLQYDPQPLGLLTARQAVSDYYASHGAAISPEHILITASTSESYSYLFRLLCSPGDNVLVPRPGYPLFDYLATLDDIELRSYDLLSMCDWAIDFDALERSINSHTRAIIVVSPNNPTGHNTSAADRESLLAFCERHNLALIVDEVFLDYQIDANCSMQGGLESPNSFATLKSTVPIYVFSGVSKVAAMPQMKLGWLALSASEPYRTQALGRLEVIADTFLSVNTPAQQALPNWLHHSRQIQSQILARIRHNLLTLAEATAKCPMLDTVAPEAGWNVLLRVPGMQRSDDFAISLIHQQGVGIHPGSFYGLPESGWLVASTIVQESVFRTGIQRLCSYLMQESNQ
jgi:alanine-synthesizing transaminase